jgi:hypothetical protein
MPPLTLENAGALVSGGVSASAIAQERKDMKAPQPGAQPTTLKVRVLRAFYFSGKSIAVKTELELPRLFALEMQAANKVELVKEEAPPPAAQPKQAEPTDKKGDRNAR